MILYLDTSALVKLYVEEDGSEEVSTAVRDASRVATSAVAYPEARATFARLEREGTSRQRNTGPPWPIWTPTGNAWACWT